MDLLREILNKLDTLSGYEGVGGIRAAARHIEVAERHLSRGRHDQDDDAFNDVIYRTNQAFEGMLEEAYAILFAPPAKKPTIHQIEQEFASTGHVSGRVMMALQRYRQEWRNPSTHDHTLLFSEQDALLSILSVSAFATVLLDQIISCVSFRRQKSDLERQKAQVSHAMAIYGEQDFDDQLVTLLMLYAKNMWDDAQVTAANEAELVGGLNGFLTTIDSELSVQQRALFDNREADLVVMKRNVGAIIEVKRGGSSGYFLDAASEQVRALLRLADLQLGFVFMPPRNREDFMAVTKLTWAGEDTQVIVVAPQSYMPAET
jgi:hypothetical protein